LVMISFAPKGAWAGWAGPISHGLRHGLRSFAPKGARTGWGADFPRLAPWATIFRPASRAGRCPSSCLAGGSRTAPTTPLVAGLVNMSSEFLQRI
jgi:hypothetical protein